MVSKGLTLTRRRGLKLRQERFILMGSSAVILNRDQINSFRENGFLALDAITLPEEVASMRAVFDRLLNSKATFREGARWDLVKGDDIAGPAKLPQIMSPVNYAPELRDTIFRASPDISPGCRFWDLLRARAALGLGLMRWRSGSGH